MSYLRKTLASIAIRIVSAGVGAVVEINSLIDFEVVALFLIVATGGALVATVYSDKFKKVFPYLLLVKSGFDSIYILMSNITDFMTGLIIAANVIFAMVFACDYLMKNVLANDKYSQFSAAAFTVCFLIPYIVVFLSLAMIIIAVMFYEVSIFLLIICLLVNACIFFKICFVFINLLLLTLNK